MARVVAETGAGSVVPAGDAGAVAKTVADLLDDDERRQGAADAGRKWAAERRWRVVAAPLLEFAANPWRDRHRERFSELVPGSVVGEEPLLQRLQRAIRRKRGGR
jgi:glycosyltransferase involved in cell wall biosynthesis